MNPSTYNFSSNNNDGGGFTDARAMALQFVLDGESTTSIMAPSSQDYSYDSNHHHNSNHHRHNKQPPSSPTMSKWADEDEEEDENTIIMMNAALQNPENPAFLSSQAYALAVALTPGETISGEDEVQRKIQAHDQELMASKKNKKKNTNTNTNKKASSPASNNVHHHVGARQTSPRPPPPKIRPSDEKQAYRYPSSTSAQTQNSPRAYHQQQPAPTTTTTTTTTNNNNSNHHGQYYAVAASSFERQRPQSENDGHYDPPAAAAQPPPSSPQQEGGGRMARADESGHVRVHFIDAAAAPAQFTVFQPPPLPPQEDRPVSFPVAPSKRHLQHHHDQNNSYYNDTSSSDGRSNSIERGTKPTTNTNTNTMEEDLEQATREISNNSSKKNQQRPTMTNYRRSLCVGMGLLLLAIVGIVVGVVVATSSSPDDDPKRNPNSSTKDGDEAQTTAAVGGLWDFPLDKAIAVVPQEICMDQVPGAGWGELCTPEETAQQGGGVCNLVAQAFLDQIQEADMAIQNSGSCLADISRGDFTKQVAYDVLPWEQTLLVVGLTGAEIVLVLEQALEQAGQNNGNEGWYPYAAGLRYNVDATASFKNRLSQVEVNRRLLQASWTAIELETTYQVVANSYIVAGGDGYDVFREIPQARKVDTGKDATETFIEYVHEQSVVLDPRAEEYSTQDYIS